MSSLTLDESIADEVLSNIRVINIRPGKRAILKEGLTPVCQDRNLCSFGKQSVGAKSRKRKKEKGFLKQWRVVFLQKLHHSPDYWKKILLKSEEQANGVGNIDPPDTEQNESRESSGN